MSLDDLGNLEQSVGALAGVVSLLYLAAHHRMVARPAGCRRVVPVARGG